MKVLITPCLPFSLAQRHPIQVTQTTICDVLRAQYRIELQLCEMPFESIVDKASSLTWVRDPFDRLIVAQALCSSKHSVINSGAIVVPRFLRQAQDRGATVVNRMLTCSKSKLLTKDNIIRQHCKSAVWD